MYQPSNQPGQSPQQSGSAHQHQHQQQQQQQQQPRQWEQASHPSRSESQEAHYQPHPQNGFRPLDSAQHASRFDPAQNAQASNSPHTSQQASNRPDMTSIHHYQQQPDPYRLPAPGPNSYYAAPHPQPQYQSQPANAQNMAQSAPRQRTAIACKYCRRRKIRCSGFENSEDGRCTNCVRFSQECVFTPVSAQTQAFVPAQAVYGRGARAPGAAAPPLYGAYGQPLAQQRDMYGQPAPPPPPPPPPQGYPLPNPAAGPYPAPPPGQQYMPPQPGYPPQPYDAAAGNRRRRDDPHTPTLPPPNPATAPHLNPSREPESQGYSYPDPTSYANGAHSPSSSNASYHAHPPQPYYAPQPPRRGSPGTTVYPYDQPRGSNSPHAPPNYAYGQPPQPPHQHQGPPPPATGDGRTPPPVAYAPNPEPAIAKAGMSIRDIITDSGNGSGERSAADSDMLSALNRPSRR